MSDKNVQEVLIDGKIYRLGGYESQEYLQKVGVYINNLLDQMREMDSWRKLSGDERHVLTQINIADDYFKAQKRIEELEDEALAKEKELYELKHQLASLRVQYDEQESQLAKKGQELAAAARTIQEQTEELGKGISAVKRATKMAETKDKSTDPAKGDADIKAERKKTGRGGTETARLQEIAEDKSLDDMQMSFDDLTANPRADAQSHERDTQARERKAKKNNE